MTRAMPPDSWLLDPERILQRSGFIRQLARRLLADASDADDLAQETWCVALRSGPRSNAAWSVWLRHVVARLARIRRRTALRRQVREQRAARPEAAPDDQELLAREDARRAVVEAVLALPEPYRSTLVLRYFEELPPRVVAARMSVPVETVRTRIKRGLAMLRPALDRTHRDWRRGLMSMPWMVPWGTGIGGLVVLAQTKLKLMAATAVLAIGALVAWQVAERAAGVGAGPMPDGSAAPMTAELPPHPLPPEPRGDQAVADPSPRQEVRPRIAATGGLRIRTVWDADGTAAPGIRLQVAPGRLGEAGAERLTSITSDSAGEATILDLRPGPFVVQVPGHEHMPGFAETSVEAGRATELQVRVGRGLHVSGRVVDEAERGVPGATVLLRGWPSYDGAMPVARCGADGEFELPATEPHAWLSARAPGFRPSLSATVAGESGVEVQVRLYLERGGSALRGRVRSPQRGPVAGAVLRLGELDRGFVDLVLPDGSRAGRPFALRVTTDGDGRYAAEGLAPGELPVVVHASGVGHWSGTVMLHAGATSELDVELQPAATLSGTVIRTDAAAASGANVTLRDRAGFARRSAACDAAGRFLLADLPAGEFQVDVELDGHARHQQPIRLNAGDDTQLEVRLDRAATQHGKVVDSAGNPVAGARLDIATAGYRGGYIETDRDGRFVVEEPPRFPWQTVRITRQSENFHCTELHRIAPVAGEEILLRIPADAEGTGTLRVRVVDRDGKPVTDAVVLPSRPGTGSPVLTVDPATGLAVFSACPPGDYVLAIEARGLARQRLGPRTLVAGGVLDFGEVRLLPAAVVEVELTEDPGARRLWFGVLGADHEWLGRCAKLSPTSYRSAGLPPGEYVLSLSGEDVAATAWQITLAASQVERRSISLAPGQRCRIELISPPPRIGSLLLRDHAGRPLTRVPMRAQPDGSLAGTCCLAPGEYSIEAPDRPARRFTVQLGTEPRIRL
jgi:RNA polymerase sigma-70 factor (ECF subfamily)